MSTEERCYLTAAADRARQAQEDSEAQQLEEELAAAARAYQRDSKQHKLLADVNMNNKKLTGGRLFYVQ